jgi:hypothetical protein
LPSDIDIHAASRCIANLLLVAKVHRSEKRLVIVANRARRYTKAYQSLMRFLQSLRIPVAAVLRDSQAYVRSAETGMGLHEMKGALLQEDLDSWKPLIDWLERRSFSLCRSTKPCTATPAAGAGGGTQAATGAYSTGPRDGENPLSAPCIRPRQPVKYFDQGAARIIRARTAMIGESFIRASRSA